MTGFDDRPGSAPITELDLLAYADGLLDEDPGRKAVIEAWLDTRPGEMARVTMWRDQNAALRQALDPHLQDPVPERLRAVLAAPRPSFVRRLGARRFMPVAAAAMVAVFASTASWMISGRGDGAGWSPEHFVEQSYAGFRTVSGEPNAAGAVTADLSGSDELASGLRIPDLTAIGFTVAARRSLVTEAGDMVQATYTGGDGERFSLFLQPRWDERSPDLEVSHRRGLSMAYWLEGSLASAVVADLPRDRVAHIADAVRKVMKQGGNAPRTTTPVVEASAPVPDAPAAQPATVDISLDDGVMLLDNRSGEVPVFSEPAAPSPVNGAVHSPDYRLNYPVAPAGPSSTIPEPTVN